MATLQERLNMKRAPLDTWSIREKLFLALTVSRIGDQNWMSVSRSLKPFQENTRPTDWFSQRNCAQQYGLLLENIETPKRKKRHSTSSSAHSTSTSPNSMLNMDTSTANDTPGEHIIRKLTWERVDELQKSILDKKAQYNQLRSEIQLLESGQISEEHLRAMYHEIQEEERQKEIQANEYVIWLNDRENRKIELERAWRPLIRTSSFNALKRKCPDFDKSYTHHDDSQTTTTTTTTTTIIPTTTITTTTTTVFTSTVVAKDKELTHLKPPSVSSSQKTVTTPSSTVSSSPLLSSLLKSPTSTANFHSNLFSTLLEKDSSEQQSVSSNKNKQSQIVSNSSRTHTPVTDIQPTTKLVTITTSALRNAKFSKSPILISTVAPSPSNSETNVSATKQIVLSTLESHSSSQSVSSNFETASKSAQNVSNQHPITKLSTPALTQPDDAHTTTSILKSKSPSFSDSYVSVAVTSASSIVVPSVAGATEPLSKITSPSITVIESGSASASASSLIQINTNTINVSQNILDSSDSSVATIPVLVTEVDSQTHNDVEFEVITVQPSEVHKLNELDSEFILSCKSTKEPEKELISKNSPSETNDFKEEIVEVVQIETNQKSNTETDETNNQKIDEKNSSNEIADCTIISDACIETIFENKDASLIENVEKLNPEQIENEENSGHLTTPERDISAKNVSIKDEVKENATESSDVTKAIEKYPMSEIKVPLESDTKTNEEESKNEIVSEVEKETKAVVTKIEEKKEEIETFEPPVDVVADKTIEVEAETVTATPILIQQKVKETTTVTTATTTTTTTTTVTTKKLSEKTEPALGTAEVKEELVKIDQKSDSVEEPHGSVRRTRLKRDYTRNTKLNRKADFDYEMNFNSDEFDEDSNNDPMVNVSLSSASPSTSSTMLSLRKKDSIETVKQSVDDKKATGAKNSSKSTSPWTDDEAFVTATSTSTGITTLAAAKQSTSKRTLNKRRISIDAESNSPSPVHSLDDERDSRTTRKSFLLLYNRLVSHKFANHFMKPITDDLAPEYNEIIKHPMDFSTIKRNIDNCCTKTVADFKRDVLLMFNNAFMYNEPDSDVFLEAAQMQQDCIQMFEQFVESQNQTHTTKRETRKSSKSVYKNKK